MKQHTILITLVVIMFLLIGAIFFVKKQNSNQNQTTSPTPTTTQSNSSASENTVNNNRQPFITVVYEGGFCEKAPCKPNETIYDDGSYKDKKLDPVNLEIMQEAVAAIKENTYKPLPESQWGECTAPADGIDKGFIFLTSKTPDKAYIMCKTFIPRTDKLFTIINTLTYEQ